jgi:hypothetical protein
VIGTVLGLLAIRVRAIGEEVKRMPQSPSGILLYWNFESMKGGMSAEEEEGGRLEEGRPPLRVTKGDEL